MGTPSNLTRGLLGIPAPLPEGVPSRYLVAPEDRGDDRELLATRVLPNGDQLDVRQQLYNTALFYSPKAWLPSGWKGKW